MNVLTGHVCIDNNLARHAGIKLQTLGIYLRYGTNLRAHPGMNVLTRNMHIYNNLVRHAGFQKQPLGMCLR